MCDNPYQDDMLADKAEMLRDSRSFGDIFNNETVKKSSTQTKTRYKPSRRGLSPPPESPKDKKPKENYYNKKFDPKAVQNHLLFEEIIVPQPVAPIKRISSSAAKKTTIATNKSTNITGKKSAGSTTKESTINLKKINDKSTVISKNSLLSDSRDYSSLFDGPLSSKNKPMSKSRTTATVPSSNLKQLATKKFEKKQMKAPEKQIIKSKAIERDRVSAKKRARPPSDSESDDESPRRSSVPFHPNPYMMLIHDRERTFSNRPRYHEYDDDDDDDDDDLMEATTADIEEEEELANRIAIREDLREKRLEEERRKRRRERLAQRKK